MNFVQKATIAALWLGLSTAFFTFPNPALSAPSDEAPPDAHAILKAAFDQWRGETSRTQMTMTVHRPSWERESVMHSWTRGTKDALVRFVKPAKDAGSATLKLGDDMWIYTPKLDRVLKLPYSMMAQSWMGSDFSYSDLAKSDALLVHYKLQITGTESQDGHTVYLIAATPLPDAPVIWGKQTLRIRDDHLILEEVFYDQDMAPVKKLTATKIGSLGKRKVYVTQMRMEKIDESDHWTQLEYESGEFDLDLPSTLFTVGNLRNPRDQWEQ